MRNKAMAIILAGMTVWSPTAMADQGSPSERAALARLVKEIDLLAPLVRKAEQKADTKARFPFDYQSLRATLDQARLQIHLHLDVERQQPRNLIGDTDG